MNRYSILSKVESTTDAEKGQRSSFYFVGFAAS